MERRLGMVKVSREFIANAIRSKGVVPDDASVYSVAWSLEHDSLLVIFEHPSLYRVQEGCLIPNVGLPLTGPDRDLDCPKVEFLTDPNGN